jgi:hypothetical protein
MKITSVQEIQKATELRKIMDLRLFAEKKETELKKHFKDLMGKEEILNIGDKFIVFLEPRERTGLDANRLRMALGERIHEFETISFYKIFNLKETKENKK